MKSVALLLCVIAFASLSQAVRYDGYMVIRFHFTTDEQFQYMAKMKDSPQSPITFWQLSRLEKYADIMIAPAFIKNYVERLGERGFTYEVLIKDVQQTMEGKF